MLGMALIVLVMALLMAWAMVGGDPGEASLIRDLGLALAAAGVVLAGTMLLPSELLARRWRQVYSLALAIVGSAFVFASLGFGALFSGG